MAKGDYYDYINKLLEDINKDNYVPTSDIPSIDLYMDQVTTFMDKNINLFKRNKDDKTLTKTMINNYSKYNILPQTDKKKYSQEHMILLMLIYYLKHSLSIPDIKLLLDSLQNITNSKDISIDQFYDTIINAQHETFDSFAQYIKGSADISKDLFKNVSSKNQEELSLITTIYMLSVQASFQKYIATQLIDKYFEKENTPDKKKSKKK